MIGPGHLPRLRARPGASLRRPLPRSRGRRQVHRRAYPPGAATSVVATETAWFAHGPAELPRASAIPRAPRARVTAWAVGAAGWLAARWQWVRPRTVPCVVAGLGMLAVVAATDYLAHPYGATTADASQATHAVRVVLGAR